MHTFRTPVQADLERIIALQTQGFNGSRSWAERMRKEPGLEFFRVLERDGAIHGILRTLPFSHCFGGRAIKGAGIASVAVAAEARGRGIGTTLMRETLAELRESGHVLSSLYPATSRIYRSVGYGWGGVRTDWKVPQKALPQATDLQAEPFDESTLDGARAVYAKVVAANNGLIERDDDWWRKRVLDAGEETQYRYLVREDGEPTGYMIYTMQRGKDDWRSTLQCRDLHWLTARAGRALLSIASLHRSVGRDLTWAGPPAEPLADLLDEDAAEIDWSFRWMMRLLDVPAAIEARGYLPHVEAGVTIAVEDPLFDANNGPWRIEVSGAAAKCARVDETPAARADVQTWASMFTGLHSPRACVRLGRLEATDAAIDALTAIFAGPLPWLSDFF